MRDRPQLSPTTALNGIQGSAGRQCQHTQAHPGRTGQNPALRAESGHASFMRPPSFSSRSIQPPGKTSSIRPPRSGQSAPTSIRPPSTPSTDGLPSGADHESAMTGPKRPQRTPRPLAGDTQAIKPRLTVGLWPAVILGTVCVMALVIAGRVAVDSTSHVAPSASPPPPPPASCEMERHQTEGSSWKKTWSLDTGLPEWENDFTWDTYACGHYIVAIHHKNDDKTDLTGFHIEGNKP